MTSSRPMGRMTSGRERAAGVRRVDRLDRMEDAVAARLLDLERRERAVRHDDVRAGAVELAEERTRDTERLVVVGVLETPRAVHPGAAFEHLDVRSGNEAEEVTGLEADLLHAEVARNVIRDAAERPGEVARQLALGVELHQVLGDVEGARRDPRGGIAGHESRVLLSEHATARRPGDDDVAPGGIEGRDVSRRAAARSLDIADVERRHPAADLVGADDLDAAPPENADD